MRLTSPGRRAWEGITRRSPAAPTLVAARWRAGRRRGAAPAAAKSTLSRLCPRPCESSISSVVPAMWLSSLRRTLRPVLAPAQVVAHRCFSKRGCRVPRAPRRGGAGPRRGSAQVPLESCHEASAAEFQARAEGLLQGPGRQLHGAAHEQGCVGDVGVRRLTKAPRAGKFIIDPDKVVRLVRAAASCRAREGRPRNASPAQVVPDLEGFKLKPYVAAAVPKMPYPLATAQLRRRAGAGADDDAAP